MPVSPAFWEKFQADLTAVRPVTHKRMFGGIGLYMGGPVFGIVDNDRVFFKVDEQTVAAYDREGAEAWMYDVAVGPVLKYREVPARVLVDPAALGDWIDAAANAAVRMDTGKRPRAKRPKA